MTGLTLLLALWSPGASACDAVIDASAFVDGQLVEHVDVVWDDGLLTWVGETGSGRVEGCAVHRAGMITPPLFALGTTLGLVEIELEDGTRDDRFARPEPITPQVRVADGYDPRSEVLPLTRQGGLLDALIVPTGGFIGGTAAVVALDATLRTEAVVRPAAGLVVDLDAYGSRAAGLSRLRSVIDEARAWKKAGAPATWAGASVPVPALSALVDAVGLDAAACGADDPVEVWVVADRAADLEGLAGLSASHGLCVGVLGGAEAWLVAEPLAEAHVVVVLDPMVYGAGSMDERHGTEHNAALLVEAGVRVSFVVPDAHRARSLRWIAGNAVRGGLAWEQALRAVTLAPRQMVGLDAPGLVVGASADLALWSGDPLDVPGELLGLFRAGDPVLLRSRQDVLVERYRTLPPPRFPDQTAP